MALTWVLTDIRTKVRAITGLLTAEDISNTDLDNKINDFYRNDFPLAAYVAEFEDWFEQVTADEDGGEYDISQDYLRLTTPMTTMDSDDVLMNVKFYQDKDTFFALYPEEEDPTEARPAAALVYGGTLYLRPEPDGVYTFRAACIKKPDALIESTAPLDIRWGKAIAYGTAIEMKYEDKDKSGADELVPIYQHLLGEINKKKMMQKNTNQRATPRC